MILTPSEIERATRTFTAQLKYNVAARAPTYAAILQGCIGDLRDGTPLCNILKHWDGLDTSAFSLRILGALHRLVLDGKAPALAAFFPTTSGTQSPDRVWPVAQAVLAEQTDYIIGYCARPPQTNEVGRSAVLLGGFLAIANQFQYPLRLLEIGASAGLNLMWDKYRTVATGFGWGDSSLELQTTWEGPLPHLTAKIAIASRAACDRDPIDIRNADDRARLESYVWAEQVHRMRRLRHACQIALNTPFRLDRADAAEWLEQELRDLPVGQTTVVYHSIFRQYVSPSTDARLLAVMAEASTRATRKSPLAWLALEVPDVKSFPDLTLTMWPGGTPTKLATAHYHGEWVKWQ